MWATMMRCTDSGQGRAAEAIDRREKLIAYRTLPSLRYYLLVSQDQRRMEVYPRDDDGKWHFEVVEIVGEVAIDCDGLTAKFSLDDIYEDVRL
jgi:Uma2 family endonuclease